MIKDPEKRKKWFAAYRKKYQGRWREQGNCVSCGIPAGINPLTKKPFWRCKAHRLKVVKANRIQYCRLSEAKRGR